MANREVNVLLLRGLAGNYYSTGLDGLALKLKHVPGVDYVATSGYGSWKVWAAQLSHWRDPTILVGHSFGANAMLRIARDYPNIKFPLLISFDTSGHCSFIVGQCGPGYVPANVSRVQNFYQTNGWLIRGQPLYRKDNTSTNIINTRVEASHTDIEDNAALHDLAINEVKRIINA